MSTDDNHSPAADADDTDHATSQDATDHETREPIRVGRFVVLERVGAGAIGVVHAGYDETLDRKVAIKLIRQGGDGSIDARPRMLKEAQALARINDPNVVQIYEAGMHDEQLFIAMEFVKGQTLRAWATTESGPRPWAEVVHAYLQAAQGLAAAHRAGLVHRDFKPDNAMIDAAAVVRVMDFGLAGDLEELEAADSREGARMGASGSNDLVTTLTRSGVLVGTPAYMSPEQLGGHEALAASDQFSFCVSLWEALFGERPFEGDSFAALAASMAEAPPRQPDSSEAVPKWLRDAVGRGLRHDPEERWPTMDALAAALAPKTPRRHALWIGVAATVAVGLAVAGSTQQDTGMCEHAAAELAEVWNGARREAIQGSLVGTNLSYAPGVWERVAPKLDGWTESWVAMHTEACEATRLSGAQPEGVMDLRIACLYRARQGLDAAAKVLEAATPEVVQNAHGVVATLPRIERCADIEALQAAVEPPTPAEADRVDAVRIELASAQAMHEAGLFDDALASVRRGQAVVEGLDYEPIRSEVDLMLGYVQDERGEYEHAEAALRRAVKLSVQWEQREISRDAMSELVFVVGTRLLKTAEALELREVATGLAAGTPEAEADIRHRFADIFAAEGKLADAEVEHRAVLKLRQEQLGVDHPDVAMSRGALAAVLLDQGKFKEAEEQQRAALDARLAALGEDHPNIALSRNTLAEILSSQGKYAEAETEHRSAMALRRKALGEDHVDVANSHSNLGTVLDLQGRHAEAEKEHRAAVALLLRTVGADHPNTGRARNNLATCLHGLGKLEEAEVEQRAVLAHLVKALGADHPVVATARNNLANVLTSQGKLADAEVEYRAAMALVQKAMGADHPDVALLRNNIAYLLRQQGKDKEAEAEYRAVLALRKKVLGADHPNIAHSQLSLATTLIKLGRADEALPLLRAAWALHERAPIPDSLAAMAAFELAKALWDAGEDRERARELGRQSVELYGRAKTPAPREKAEAWLRAHGG